MRLAKLVNKLFLCFSKKTNANKISKGKTSQQKTGALAEELAAKYLQKQGVKIIHRNLKTFNKGRRGEVDLLCKDGELWVFVEVRYRAKGAMISAGASIKQTKKQAMIRAARQIMQKQKILQARIDAVLIDGEQINWVKNIASMF